MVKCDLCIEKAKYDAKTKQVIALLDSLIRSWNKRNRLGKGQVLK